MLTSCSCLKPNPIGVFWDIENCCIPNKHSAMMFVSRIREQFFDGHFEVEFMGVCDINTQSKSVLLELNYSQVTIVHICAVSKNTADDKLRQSLRRFAAFHPPPATVILITSDINFASELSDLRYRHNYRTILIHRKEVSPSLLSIPNEHYDFESFFTSSVHKELHIEEQPKENYLLVKNLPPGKDSRQLKYLLEKLFSTTKGKVSSLQGDIALVVFPTFDAALRTKNKFSHRRVCGQKIDISLPNGHLSNFLPLHAVSTTRNICEPSPVFGASVACDLCLHDGGEGSSPSTSDSPRGVQEYDGNVINDDVAVVQHFQFEPGLNARQILRPITSRFNDDFGVTDFYVGMTGEKFMNKLESHAQVVPTNGTSLLQHYKNKMNRKCSLKAHNEDIHDRIPRHQPGSNKFVVAQVFTYNKCHPKSIENYDDMTCGTQFRAFAEKNIERTSSYKSNHREHNPIGGHGHKQDYSLKAYNHPSSSCIMLKSNENHPSESSVLAGKKFYPEVGEESKHFLSSLSWQPQGGRLIHHPSSRSYFEESFRRTPGARRPTNHHQLSCGDHVLSPDELRSQLLFSSFSPKMYSGGAGDCTVGDGKYSKSSAGQRNHSASSQRLAFRDRQNFVQTNGANEAEGVYLVVSNLDYNISTHEWKKILSAEFQNVQIRSLSVQMQANNTSIATIQVATMEDAKYIVSQFHRKKIGYKRIHVSILSPDSNDSQSNLNRSEILNLLNSLPGKRLPLFQFFELFEKRYQKSISVLDLQDMSDCLDVIDQEGIGKVVLLSSEELRREVMMCSLCCGERVERSTWENIDMDCCPKVKLLLRTFSPQVHKLLQCHEGGLPINSFPACYAREFFSLTSVIEEDGVPLEHLITCVPGVEIITLVTGVKKLQWSENHSVSPINGISTLQKCKSPQLNKQMTQLSHELVELLKNTSKCSIELNKFFISYHQYFGKQFQCSDYGFGDVLELLRALSHVQVIGSGERGCITLNHRSQVERFSSDLLRILKSQNSRPRINILELPSLYSAIIGKSLDITEFGVCFVEDILMEVPDSLILIGRVDKEIFISTPSKEPISEEVDKRIQYGKEIVELLRSCQNFKLPIANFPGVYNQKFGVPFKLAECGLQKFSDLVEALSNSVKIIEVQMEKYLCLTGNELVKLAEEQLIQLLSASPQRCLTVTSLLNSYNEQFGYHLRLADFDVHSFGDLVDKMSRDISLEQRGSEQIVVYKKVDDIDEISSNVLLIIMDFSDGCMLLKDLQKFYKGIFNENIDESFLLTHMREQILVQKSSIKEGDVDIKLTTVQMFARDVRLLLLNQNLLQIPLSNFEDAYLQFFGVSLVPASYGHQSLASLLKSIFHTVVFDGRLSNWNICLQPKFKIQLNKSQSFSSCKELQYSVQEPSRKSSLKDNDAEIECRYASAISGRHHDVSDLMSDVVPSPQIEPLSFLSLYRKKDKKAPVYDLLMLTKDEKKGLKTPLCRTPVSELLAFAAQLLPPDVCKNSGLERRMKNHNQSFQAQDTTPTDEQCILPRSQTVDFSSFTQSSLAESRNLLETPALIPVVSSKEINDDQAPEMQPCLQQENQVRNAVVTPVQGSQVPAITGDAPSRQQTTPSTSYIAKPVVSSVRKSRIAAKFGISNSS